VLGQLSPRSDGQRQAVVGLVERLSRLQARMLEQARARLADIAGGRTPGRDIAMPDPRELSPIFSMLASLPDPTARRVAALLSSAGADTLAVLPLLAHIAPELGRGGAYAQRALDTLTAVMLPTGASTLAARRDALALAQRMTSAPAAALPPDVASRLPELR